MKVSCQSCGANYNLPDDKVRGKKAKVRCKKCGASIVVDGTSQAASPSSNFDEEEEATRVMDMPVPPSDLWTVNLSDEDQREMSTAEIVVGWRDKLVSEDAYVWRDGMDEWLPILSSELGSALRAGDSGVGAPPPSNVVHEQPAAPTPSVPEVARKEPSSAHAAPAPVALTPPSSPLAAASPLAATSPLAAASPAKPKATTATGKRPSVTAGLFGPLPDKGTAKPAPAKTTARPIAASTGAPKNAENSVMFSLDALKAAAAVETKGTQEPETRVSEDLLTLGGPSGFELNPLPLIQIDAPPPVQAAIAPQLSLATQAAPAKSSSLNTVVIALIGLGLIGAVFFGVRSALTPSAAGETAPTAVSKDEPRKAAADEAAQAPAAAESAAAAEPAKAEASGAAAKEESKPTEAAAKPSAAGAHGAAAVKPAGGGGGGGSAAPSKPAKETGGGSAPAKPAKETGGGGGGGGAAFDVAAAKDALGSAASQAKLCKTGDGPTGTGKVQVTFAPSGRVTSANVQGPPFAGTSVGGCVARAFRGARVPSFDGSPQTVSKGFTIN